MERASGAAGRAEAPGSVHASWAAETGSAPRAGSAVKQPRALWFLALWHLTMVLSRGRCGAGSGAEGEGDAAAVSVAECEAVLAVKAAREAEDGWEGTWRGTAGESVCGASDGVVRGFCVISEESLTNCAGLWPQESPETLLVLIMFLQ